MESEEVYTDIREIYLNDQVPTHIQPRAKSENTAEKKGNVYDDTIESQQEKHQYSTLTKKVNNSTTTCWKLFAVLSCVIVGLLLTIGISVWIVYPKIEDIEDNQNVFMKLVKDLTDRSNNSQRISKLKENHQILTELVKDLIDENITKNHLNHAAMTAWTTWNGTTYSLSHPIIRDVAAASTVCRQFGGYLIEIDNEEEYQFVSDWCLNTLRHTSRAPGVILGATDGGHEGKWTFLSSGNRMSTIHWAPNEPNGMTTENCLFVSAKSRLMFDAACTVQFEGRFMCEVDEPSQTD